MPVRDQYAGGLTERLVGKVVTVNKPASLIELVAKDAAVLSVQVWAVAGSFIWPEVAEYWTITRENGRWGLEARIPEENLLQALNSGTLLLDGDTIVTRSGEELALKADLDALEARVTALGG